MVRVSAPVEMQRQKTRERNDETAWKELERRRRYEHQKPGSASENLLIAERKGKWFYTLKAVIHWPEPS